MNLYPNIEFSNNLIENNETTITYSGYLFQKNSESVTIVYGFGNSWSNTTELEMEKNDNGFSVKIKALEFSNFNFCFRNSNYEWDNNNYQNYTAPISKPKLEDAFIINEGIINTIADNIVKYDISEIKEEKLISPEVNTSNEIIQNEFSDNNNNNNNNILEDFEINVENNEPINIEDSTVTISEENSLNEDIAQLFDELYEEKTSSVVEKENNITEEDNLNIDSLVNEILAPVEESTIFNEETFTINDSLETIHQEIAENTNELEEDEKVNSLINGLITDLYENVNSATKETVDNHENNFFSEDENNITVSIETVNNSISIEVNNEPNINNELIEEISNDINNISKNNSSNDNFHYNNYDNVEILEENYTQEFVNIIDDNEFEDNLQEKVQEINENNSLKDFLEDSLLNDFNNSDDETSVDISKALIETDNSNEFMISPRKLSKAYILKKKVKLAFYKLLSLPKTLFSNFGESNN